MESFNLNERRKCRKFSLSHRLQQQEEKFRATGGKFQEYSLQSKELFLIEGTKSLDEGKLSFVTEGVNFVGRVSENNGVKGKIKKQDFEPNQANTITATVIGNYKYVKFQEEPYYCSQNINKLVPNFEINKSIALYLLPHIQKFVSQYNGQQGGYKLEELKQHKIKLPVKNNQIDFDYMEERIRVLEEERIRVLEAYLKVTGLDKCILTEEEQKAYDAIHNGRGKFRLYTIESLFKVYSPKKRFNANAVKFGGKYPYVVRTSQNNGIRDYITEDEKYLSPANTFSFGQDTATVFYQEKKYFTGDKIKVMQAKNFEMNADIACYFISAIRKAFSHSVWGQDSFNETILNNTKIYLPVNQNDEIDYELMETYIRAIEKKVIKNVVDWKNAVIEKTKEVVSD